MLRKKDKVLGLIKRSPRLSFRLIYLESENEVNMRWFLIFVHFRVNTDSEDDLTLLTFVGKKSKTGKKPTQMKKRTKTQDEKKDNIIQVKFSRIYFPFAGKLNLYVKVCRSNLW